MKTVLGLIFASCLLLLNDAFYCDALSSVSPKHTLYDIPVSNNGARCRIIINKKQLEESEVSILSPAQLGGFRSEEYLKVSPQGKVPALQIHDSGLCLAESDTCARYLISTYEGIGPSFQPNNPISNQIARFHDLYLTTIQTCLYRAAPPFGSFHTRQDALKEYSKQLYVIADLFPEQTSGPYICGSEVSLADATLFPSVVFASYMYPKFAHLEGSDFIPDKITKWFQGLIASDEAFRKVYDEMMGALQKWDENGRWDSIWLAGVRDKEPETLFDKIISGEIPATIVKEDDKMMAFKDINPAAPAHVLVIPKDRNGLTRLSKATKEQSEMLGHLMLTAGEIAADESLGFGNGARIVVNDGKSAGQEVFHLHIHVLGGREFTWPPG
ncbi:unnamed protein product [Cylindrotheca closterium]|uniref:HIT domain-containing protein n=1 Tax=Cylindrotheca closterium TaxID=2856 RepID=A0AAD2CMC1_9STRA|nr:unnamed protein product [Cylindrotheca closterium]